MSKYQRTRRWGYSRPSAFVEADESLTNMKNASIPDDAYHPIDSQNAVEVAFELDEDGEEVVGTLYAARYNEDIVQVWTGTITAGTQEATSGEVYADTFSSTTDTWIGTVTEVDGGGNNRMARLVFDSFGYYSFFFVFTGISSEKVKPIFSGF